jgi:hypothetical protein
MRHQNVSKELAKYDTNHTIYLIQKHLKFNYLVVILPQIEMHMSCWCHVNTLLTPGYSKFDSKIRTYIQMSADYTHV